MTMPAKPSPKPTTAPPRKVETLHITLSKGRGVTVQRVTPDLIAMEFTREDVGVSMKTQLCLTQDSAQALYTLMGLQGFATQPIAMTMTMPTVTWARKLGKIRRVKKSVKRAGK